MDATLTNDLQIPAFSIPWSDFNFVLIFGIALLRWQVFLYSFHPIGFYIIMFSGLKSSRANQKHGTFFDSRE